MIEQFYQVLLVQVRVGLGVMTKSYSTFPKDPELKPYYQMQFRVIPMVSVVVEVLLLGRGAVRTFYRAGNFMNAILKFMVLREKGGKKPTKIGIAVDVLDLIWSHMQ